MPIPTHVEPVGEPRRLLLEQQPDAGGDDEQREDGSMCPTAKIARAIVVEPPESSSTLRLISTAESKYSHHSARGEGHRGDERGPATDIGIRAGDGRLARLDEDLAEQDDEEQAEALGEVVGVERLLRVGRRERGQVAVAARAPHRLAVLGQHRARLDARSPRPEQVPERLGHGDRDGEQRRRRQHARAIRRAGCRCRPRPPRSANARMSRMTARLAANTATSPFETGSMATAATPAGMLARRKRKRWAGSSAPWRL